MEVAGELPQTGFQVEVPVKTQSAVPPQSTAELIGRRISHALRIPSGSGDEAVTCGDLAEIKQVGAAVVSDAGSIRTESQVKVHQRPSGDYRKHTCDAERPTARTILTHRDEKIQELKKT